MGSTPLLEEDFRQACYQECERLLALVSSLATHGQVPCIALKRLEEEVNSLRRDDVEPLKLEAELQRLAVLLRQTWLGLAHTYSDSRWKSPSLLSETSLPFGNKVWLNYERNLQPEFLEKRAIKEFPAPNGWFVDHVLFSSGMSGFSTLLLSLIAMKHPSKIRIGFWGGYFEIPLVLNLLRSSSLSWSRIPDQPSLREAVTARTFDVLIIEPVAFTSELEVLDLAALLEACPDSQSRAISAIIVDVTLVAGRFPIEDFLASCRSNFADLVIIGRSGIKMDQQGLELSNVGLYSLYSSSDGMDATKLQYLGRHVRETRNIIGTGLSLDSVASLSAPFFLNRAKLEEYTERVFTNNALLAKQLASYTGGIFTRVVHPKLVEGVRPNWACAPFVIFHLARPDKKSLFSVMAVIQYCAEIRGLCLTPGSSFGFRENRYEALFWDVDREAGFLKIAAGSRSGPSLKQLVSLLQEIAKYNLPDELLQAFPDAAGNLPK
jgi:hypothetical protein